MAGVLGVVELMQRTAVEASPDLLRALQTHTVSSSLVRPENVGACIPALPEVVVLALARMLGHKDPSVTLRVHARLFDTDLDVVAVSLHTKYWPKKCVQTVSTAPE